MKYLFFYYLKTIRASQNETAVFYELKQNVTRDFFQKIFSW